MTQALHLQALKDRELDKIPVILRQNPNAQIVKYSPEKRCLFCVEVDGKEYFVKIYPKKFLKRKRGLGIHSIGEKLWRLSEERRFDFVVPKSICWDEKTRTIWQEKVVGETASSFSEACVGAKIPFEIGKGVAIISKLEIMPPRLFNRLEQLKDSKEYSAKIERFAPHLNIKLSRFFNLLGDVKLPEEKLVPIHGDMHIDQWLFDGKRLALLDFEDFSFGEIERDLASFIVQIRSEYPHFKEGFTDSFLEGFRFQGMLEDERLMQFYSAHKWLAKASKYENFAEQFLDKALQCLEFLA